MVAAHLEEQGPCPATRATSSPAVARGLHRIHAMSFTLVVFAAALGLFVGIIFFLELGRRLGARAAAHEPADATSSTGTIDAAVFSLLGLLVAFTFSGAAGRFDARRRMIVDEGNAISTAYLRLAVLPAPARSELEDLFRSYVDSRIATYRVLPDLGAARQELARSKELQQAIWQKAAAAIRIEGAHPASGFLVLPALNQMFDLATVRTMASLIHPPGVIFEMMFAIALISALVAGYGLRGRKSLPWIHALGYAAVLSTAVYVIIDLEFPHLGLLRVDDFDRLLIEVRAGMQ